MTPTAKTNTAVSIDTLDAATIRDNLPEVAPSPVERVVTALSDSDWDGVPDGHVGGALVSPRLPRIGLCRKVGQKAGADTKASGFTDELTGEVFMEATFVWLGDTATRAYFPLPFGEGDKAPACRSADGVTPDPTSPAQQAGWEIPVGRKGPGKGTTPTGVCASCPNAQWVDGEAACDKSIEVMVYLLDSQRLSLIRFGGGAETRAMRYLGALNAHVPVRPPLAYVTHVELVEEQTANGTFLFPHFTPVGEIARVDANPLIALQKAKLSEWVDQLAADLAEGATREGAPAAAGHADAGYPDEEPF